MSLGAGCPTMHFSAQFLELSQAVASIRQRLPINGSILNVTEVLTELQRENLLSSPVLIENAILAWPAKLPPDLFPAALILRHCTLVALQGDSILLQRAAGAAPVRIQLQACTLLTNLCFKNCIFDSLRLESAECRGVIEFTDCVYAKPPEFLHSTFKGQVTFDGVTCLESWGKHVPAAWVITRCQFHDDLAISSPSACTEFQFQHTTLAVGCRASIHLGPSRDADTLDFAARFDYCQINGRTKLYPFRAVNTGSKDNHGDQKSSEAQEGTSKNADSSGDVKVSPQGFAKSGERENHASASGRLHVRVFHSSIAGEFDISAVPLRRLTTESSSFAGGEIRIPSENLVAPSDPFRFLIFWRWNPADRCGVLDCEQRYRESNSTRKVEIEERHRLLLNQWLLPVERAKLLADQLYTLEQEAEDLAQIAAEYGELRNAFSRVAGAIEEENFCHYKFKRLQHEASQVQARIEEIARQLRPDDLMAPAAHRGFLTGLGWFLDGWVLQVCLGYGVYARRAFGTSIGIIFLFSLCYCFFSLSCPEYGCIVSGDLTVSGSRSPFSGDVKVKEEPVHWSISFGRCLYYSVVTFTTLGYGDYTPKGILLVPAALEALTGAVMLAFLTVVFARKFIR